MARYVDAELLQKMFKDAYGIDISFDAVPTADVAPIVHAHWICKSVDDNDNGEYTCSRCGYGEEHSINCEVPYCWRCGAKMDGVIHNE